MTNTLENKNVKIWPSDGSVTLSFRSRSLKLGSIKFLNMHYHDTKGEYSTLKLAHKKNNVYKNKSIHLRRMLTMSRTLKMSKIQKKRKRKRSVWKNRGDIKGVWSKSNSPHLMHLIMSCHFASLCQLQNKSHLKTIHVTL